MRSRSIVFLAIFLLTGCAPLLPSPPQLPTPMETLGPTAVAPEAVADTPAPTETLTPTDLPTETPNPTPTFTEVPAATHTAIPTDTPTITPTLAPTFVPGDPRAELGPPDWVDHFEDDANWSPYANEVSKVDIVDGYFFYFMFPAHHSAAWLTTSPQIKDFYLEVTVRTPMQCTGISRYGLSFRMPDPSKGYFFSVACNGDFRLHKWDGSELTILSPWYPHLAVHGGPGQINRIGVKAEGDHFTLYVNGFNVAEVDDSAFRSAGFFGLLIGTAEGGNFIVAYDDLMYWLLDPEE